MNAALAPRKTPRQARAQATRDAILEAAAQILSVQGLAGFNTNAVAQRAGVSIGSLYQYFTNKDALMAALIHQLQSRQIDTIEEAARGLENAGLEESVRALVRAAQKHHRDDTLLATAVDHEEARLAIQIALDPYLERGGMVIARMLGRHLDELGSVDIQRAMRTIPHMARAVGDACANLSPPDLRAAEEEAVRAVMGYLTTGRN